MSNEHYSVGRRYSHISNMWILESSWNDKEEIAMLKHENQTLTELVNELQDEIRVMGGDYE